MGEGTETIEEWAARTAPALTSEDWVTQRTIAEGLLGPWSDEEVAKARALLAYRDKVAAGLTKPRKRALAIMADDVEYSPGESYCNRNGTVRSDVMRRLSAAKLVRSWGLHEWGPHPVYVWTRTDFGAEVARILEAQGEAE